VVDGGGVRRRSAQRRLHFPERPGERDIRVQGGFHFDGPPLALALELCRGAAFLQADERR
jgi:hypothetical protein